MRVTQSMLSSNMLRNLTQSYEKMGRQQEQIATQKKISRPSDDPVVAMKGVLYRRNLTEVEQYKRNFSEAYNWVENADSSLDKANQAMQRLRELLVQTSNDTYDADQRKATRAEIEQLKEHIEEIGNTKFGDKYLFNGTDTTNKPLDVANGVYPENNESVEIELSKGVHIKVNIDGTSVFSQEMFDDIDNIIATLEDENSTGDDINNFITNMDTHMTNLSNERSSLGARYNRIELMDSRVSEQEVIATRVMSDNEDIDFEKVITDMKVQESVHRAALSVGSRIIQPSLMDFLR
ncbi:flagellar hook-associated protein FlgL [Jeotgalibacillus haloalkalitolerans]|uniref:Flagellar hook-associated protein FlgL n=1 Tax=Jeotgalibacillus haloalkalitolerans TaxID=3104292 RepID=A0ABU5KJN9_9BACL|nr:flagellar hook-associated protein FlgL [Jeotgalibacillus sp. HH7-29]MDZ5711477.1 flagellar hook-associated protein FlgL [Jeotgalibacillus sp. HH7-29]